DVLSLGCPDVKVVMKRNRGQVSFRDPSHLYPHRLERFKGALLDEMLGVEPEFIEIFLRIQCLHDPVEYPRLLSQVAVRVDRPCEVVIEDRSMVLQHFEGTRIDGEVGSCLRMEIPGSSLCPENRRFGVKV